MEGRFWETISWRYIKRRWLKIDAPPSDSQGVLFQTISLLVLSVYASRGTQDCGFKDNLVPASFPTPEVFLLSALANAYLTWGLVVLWLRLWASTVEARSAGTKSGEGAKILHLSARPHRAPPQNRIKPEGGCLLKYSLKILTPKPEEWQFSL